MILKTAVITKLLNSLKTNNNYTFSNFINIVENLYLIWYSNFLKSMLKDKNIDTKNSITSLIILI